MFSVTFTITASSSHGRPDPHANERAFYDQQYKHIIQIFTEGEEEDEAVDWNVLYPMLAEALANPYLPRLHRAKYHVLAAAADNVDMEAAREHIICAEELVTDMLEVLHTQGRSPESVEACARPIAKEVRLLKDDLEEVTDE